MNKAIAGIILLAATLIGIQVLLSLNEQWAGPSSQELIDQLVTTNPRTTGDWAEKQPIAWDSDEEARVLRVWRRLEKDPRRHMPALIANVERREFSTAISTAVPYAPLSVGYICGWIIEDHFYRHAYRAGLARPEGKDSREHYFGVMRRATLLRWWKDHQHLSDEEIGELIKKWHLLQPPSPLPVR